MKHCRGSSIKGMKRFARSQHLIVFCQVTRPFQQPRSLTFYFHEEYQNNLLLFKQPFSDQIINLQSQLTVQSTVWSIGSLCKKCVKILFCLFLQDVIGEFSRKKGFGYEKNEFVLQICWFCVFSFKGTRLGVEKLIRSSQLTFIINNLTCTILVRILFYMSE